MKSLYEELGGTYHQVGDYFIPDIELPERHYEIGKYGSISCHATSFIRVVDGKIASVDEYWGDDGAAPQWRQDKHIGITIKE